MAEGSLLDFGVVDQLLEDGLLLVLAAHAAAIEVGGVVDDGAHLEELGQVVVVVGLVEAVLVQARPHLDDGQVVLGLLGQVAHRHVEPVLALGFAAFGLAKSKHSIR